MIVDTHIHTYPWSPDGGQSISELVHTLNEKHLNGGVITDHYDYNSITEEEKRWMFDTAEYYKELIKYRIEPSLSGDLGKAGILIGIEISFCRNHIVETRRLIKENYFDQVIMSVHDYQGIDPVLNPELFYQAPDLLVEDYKKVINEIIFSMESIPEAHICGHYDFFSRYPNVKNPKMQYKQNPSEYDRLFHTLIKNQQGLEINTGTISALHKKYHFSIEDAMPDSELISRYREMGGQIITIASDAHEKKDNARYFNEALQWMKKQGINKLYWMENRNWCCAPI